MSNEEKSPVWAFGGVEKEQKEPLYESIKSGKSRFGWSYKDEHNLLGDNWTPEHGKQQFLLKIKEGDWIVHINLPEWGKCVAVKVCSKYGFDKGFPCSWGTDFKHFFEIDTDSVIEFYRRDPRILPSVKLGNRGRYWRIKEIDDFYQSMENLKGEKQENQKQEDHLKNKLQPLLPQISEYIHKMHPSKKLEGFLAEVFRKIPTVVEVEENGYGWRTDHGADLIVKTSAPIGYLSLENTIIVQVKSYEGTHHNLNAVDQIQEGIKEYGGTAGMIITTAEKVSKELENKVQEASDKLNMEIALLDATDLAKFIIKHAPEDLFKLDF